MVLENVKTFEEAAEEIAKQLTQIKADKDKVADAKSWEMATTYVLAYSTLEEAYQQDMGKRPTPQAINKAIREFEGYEGPGGSWLNHAKRLYGFCPDIFLLLTTRKLPYNDYRHIANCALPEDKKRLLLSWAEERRPKQSDLRMEIRKRVDAEKGISKPDFDLKSGNVWTFGHKTSPNGFEGGILPDLVANLLHYFTDPGDIIIDPMAGGDTTFKTIQHYQYFKSRNDALPFSGPRHVYRADIDPRYPGIERADVRNSLPWSDEFADFCLLDPPYFKMADGRYDTFGETIGEWCENLSKAVRNIKQVLKPTSALAIIVDDYSRSREFHPLAFYAFSIAQDAGLSPIRTIYNTYANFVVTMGPLEMKRAQLSRTPVNQVKIISVFEKP